MAKDKITNIIFCGLGGQGVLRASEACGWAAVYDGYHVKKSEVHGMAQRGGFVESHLRFGKEVFSPLVPKGQGDFLVCFHEDEHERMKAYLGPKGVDMLDSLLKAGAVVGEKKYMNSYLLGVLAKSLSISEDSWIKAIDTVFAGKDTAKNKQVFMEGYTRSEKR